MASKKILLIIGGIILVAGVIWMFVSIYNQEKMESKYGDCLKVFSDKYCQDLNYSESSQWGNGFNPYIYFKCKSERDYQGYGEFINTNEEKEYCKDAVFSGGKD